MASSSATPMSPDTLVTLKVNIEGSNRRLKLPLRELGANTLPDKLRFLLAIPPSSDVVFERFSDSAGEFVVLDSNNLAVYKQLYRAAKAKLKLRLKVTVKDKEPTVPKPATVEDESLEEQNELTNNAPLPSSTTQMQDPSLSIAQIQSGLENLLLNRATAASAPAVTTPPALYHANSVPYSPGATSSIAAKSNASANTEIPVSQGVAAREKWFAELAGICTDRQTALRTRSGPPAPSQASTYSVYCNNCQHPIPDEHYHCSTCDDGDFDLCQNCIDDGVLCGGEGHWLIKRFVKNGTVVTSTTKTLEPRKLMYIEPKETQIEVEETKESASRTCNSCIQEFPEENFVTCTTCDDFDLCIPCHTAVQHGHNPKHPFTPATADTSLDSLARTLLDPGRNVSHQAICDGCDKYINGVRHKCLDCPDWDYCSTCITNSGFIHPRHRFVPIYEPLNDANVTIRDVRSKARHFGIFCDGPLCKIGSSYITGDRYKCAVCHDTDFCAGCEASPSNFHNKTHPLIKFKTPVRNVSVTTMGDHDNGLPMPIMGDRRGQTTSKSTETTPLPFHNAATQVQTVADLKPTEALKLAEVVKPEVVVKDEPSEVTTTSAEEELVAHFVRDAIPDGSVIAINTVFEQTWVLKNSGEKSWPAGCTVKFVGGDNMCAVDPEHPASVHELVSAAESTTCYTEVAPGQEVGFTVLMRTPNRPGKVISYWRLTGPTGFKFGHRLWCDVTAVDLTPAENCEEVVKDAEKSQMIFPTLEKESPATSIHEEVTTKEPTEADDFEYAVDDNVTLEDDETEDGFVTDEEYDILDASDEEFLAEQGKVSKK